LEEISKLYQGYRFSFRPRDLSLSHAKKLLADRESMTHDVRLNRLSALSGSLEGKRLLEIGCGCGELLVGALHRRASVFGNDVSRESCRFVGELLHIPVCEGPLSAVAFEREFGQMDIVVMSNLIEHPVEPLATFESALSVLKPAGLLLILTPNGGAASDEPSSASQWVGFRVDLEHLQYLSARTVSTLAAEYRCDIEHLETFGYPGLQGIDRLPASSFVANRSLKGLIKAQLKKSDRVRKVVRTVRAFRSPDPPDPRCGTYHLLTVLRKRSGVARDTGGRLNSAT
jgi:SAM-dependent methyltransferase